MTASDVYNVAKALPVQEQEQLYNMLKNDVREKCKFDKKRKNLPKFTVEDGIQYLMDTHFSKIRKP